LLWIMPLMIFTGVLYLSLPTFAMCFCYMIAMYEMIPVPPLGSRNLPKYSADISTRCLPCASLSDLDSDLISLLAPVLLTATEMQNW
jgi:hypothetical protein